MSVTEARELAIRAHGDQRDRDGSLHIDHVARVAEAVEPSAQCQRVAWLHDVLEDSELGAEALERLPKAEGDAGRLARAVKEADMLDNLRRCVLARDPAVGQYGEALARLWTVENA